MLIANTPPSPSLELTPGRRNTYGGPTLLERLWYHNKKMDLVLTPQKLAQEEGLSKSL